MAIRVFQNPDPRIQSNDTDIRLGATVVASHWAAASHWVSHWLSHASDSGCGEWGGLWRVVDCSLRPPLWVTRVAAIDDGQLNRAVASCTGCANDSGRGESRRHLLGRRVAEPVRRRWVTESATHSVTWVTLAAASEAGSGGWWTAGRVTRAATSDGWPLQVTQGRAEASDGGPLRVLSSFENKTFEEFTRKPLKQCKTRSSAASDLWNLCTAASWWHSVKQRQHLQRTQQTISKVGSAYFCICCIWFSCLHIFFFSFLFCAYKCIWMHRRNTYVVTAHFCIFCILYAYLRIFKFAYNGIFILCIS